MKRYLSPGYRFSVKEKSGEFEIINLIGCGASCAVYRADFIDEYGNRTEHLLKEFNPKKMELLRNEEGTILLANDDEKSIFELALNRFCAGYERQLEVRRMISLKNVTSNIQGIYFANGTQYIDMTCFDGVTYDKIEESSVYDLARRMKTITQVIKGYHDSGFLHLDVKPENVFTIPETTELIMLFDFDSVIESGKVMLNDVLSYTKAWAAPEQFMIEKRNNICEATDLFAIGEIMFWQLMGRHSLPEERRSFSNYNFDLSRSMFDNVNPKVLPLLKDILNHTICSVAKLRYQSADLLINKLDEIIKIANPEKPYLRSSALNMQEFFIGRDFEIKEMRTKLTEKNILFLSGMGGIGKSELAKRYATKYKDLYDTILFVPYLGDVSTLLQDDNYISIYNFGPYPEEKRIVYGKRKYKKLKELCDKNTLFILDNLDRADDPNIKLLFDLDCKLLITTRLDFSEYDLGEEIILNKLTDHLAIRELFNNYYTRNLSFDEETIIEELISFVDGHTMTVELIAKQMMAGRVLPAEMLERLYSGGINKTGNERIRIAKDGTLAAQSAYNHIRSLFDLSKLTEDELYVLSNLSLFPYTGISTKVFHNWCEIADYDCINTLIALGWIKWEKEKDYIALHPIISEIVYNVLETPNETWKTLLKNVMHFVDKDWSSLPGTEKTEMITILRKILSIVYNKNTSSKTIATFLGKVSHFLQLYSAPKEYEKYLKRSLDIRKNLYGEENYNTAISYHRLGTYYRLQGQYKKAEIHFNAKLAIIESLYGSDSYEYGKSLEQLGVLYRWSREFKKAEELLIQVNQIYISCKGEDSFLVTKNNLNLAAVYNSMGRLEEAEKLYLDNLERREKNNLSTKNVHGPLGTLYRYKKDYEKSIYHLNKYLNLHLEQSIEENINVAAAYTGLGTTYLWSGDLDKACFALSKALSIKRRILGEEHMLTAESYYRLGLAEMKMRKYEEAKEHFLQAYKIRMELFGEENSGTINAKEKIQVIEHLSLQANKDA